ncbi:hypothetical protein [Aporhodopirellula aestuarii]|uniref:Cytochrome C Planctomycete-type domain-containing protein n=1 Tax=Aporhodopirellula aestuarii TaxID=2950107 RepID=A0ABT0U268_9BACT|nr:hypothetical protein [Aporhodopirellula aestuarii]MCM2370583.1 hypothetical protein [Aporhodopirellula aestuarii]
MPSKIGLLLYSGLLLTLYLLGNHEAVAQSPLPGSPSNQTQYVLLNNDRVLSGTVWARGQSVIVRRGNEAELTLQARQVVAVADDLPALFEARIRSLRRRTLPSVDDLIGDLRWCIDQGLPNEATGLLMKIYAVSPNHPVALQLESRLRRMAVAQSTPNASPENEINETVDDFASEGVSPASHMVERQPLEPALSTPALPINPTTAPASLHYFTAKVQPILISRCARCHHDEAPVATNWNLVLPPSGALRVTQRGSIANLEATLAYCDPRNPFSSTLIEKATLDHHQPTGTEPSPNEKPQPPIAEHELALVRTLGDWISSLPPQKSRLSGPATTTTDIEAVEEGPLSPIRPSEVAAFLSSPPAPEMSDPSLQPEPPLDEFTPFPEPQHRSVTDPGLSRPVRLPIVENPDDVRHFNRETRLRRQLGLGSR